MVLFDDRTVSMCTMVDGFVLNLSRRKNRGRSAVVRLSQTIWATKFNGGVEFARRRTSPKFKFPAPSKMDIAKRRCYKINDTPNCLVPCGIVS